MKESGSSETDLRCLINYRTQGGGQAVRKRGIEVTWALVQRFLSEFAVLEPLRPAKLYLYEADEHAPTFDVRPHLEETVERFGRARVEIWAEPAFPDSDVDLELRQSRGYVWVIEPAQLDQVVEFLIAGEPWPDHYMGPFNLAVSWRFRLRDPRTGEILPFQDESHYPGEYWSRSHLHLTLKSGSLAVLDLNFPFERPGEAFLDYVQQMAPVVPIRLSANRFHLLKPDPAGKDYVTTRLELGLFDT